MVGARIVEAGVAQYELEVAIAGWGGPATTLLTIRLEPRGTGTVLRVSDALIGQISDAQVESLRTGWARLFGDGLKTFAEGGDGSSDAV